MHRLRWRAPTTMALTLAAAGAAVLTCGGTHIVLASPRTDTAHLAAHRQDADACVLRAVVIYTDPYIGGHLSYDEVVAAIAGMCAAPLRLYAEDLGLAAPAAERLAQHLIGAGLHGQLPAETGRPPLQDAP